MAEPSEAEGGRDSTAREAVGYWRANVRLQVVLLAIWALFGFVLAILLVRPLNELTLGGVPLGFWIAQQGAIFVFVVLILVYAWTMDRLDHEYNVQEEELGAARRRVDRREQRRGGGAQKEGQAQAGEGGGAQASEGGER